MAAISLTVAAGYFTLTSTGVGDSVASEDWLVAACTALAVVAAGALAVERSGGD